MHTKEPWRVQEGFLTIYALSDGDTGVTTAIAKPLSHQVGGGEKESEANARRIVACVNALTGFSIEELEGASLFADSVATQNKIDELLAALKAIRDIPDNLYGGDWDEIDKAREIARSAIAKCES